MGNPVTIEHPATRPKGLKRVQVSNPIELRLERENHINRHSIRDGQSNERLFVFQTGGSEINE